MREPQLNPSSRSGRERAENKPEVEGVSPMKFVVAAHQPLELAACELKLRGKSFVNLGSKVHFLCELPDNRSALGVHLTMRIRNSNHARGLIAGENNSTVQM